MNVNAQFLIFNTNRTSLPRAELRLPATHERVFELLLMKAKCEVESSGYNWVRPTLWTAVFGGATKAKTA
jgi:hypothetical protein